MSRTLLGGGIESAAEWAAVASHENAHARGFLEERDAHMSGLATYLGVTKTLGITADEKLVTEMLFGAIMNDNSANEDGVYHWTLALKDDGSGTYGWREDGSLDFNEHNPPADDIAQMISYIHVMNAREGSFVYPSKDLALADTNWTVKPFANKQAIISTNPFYIPQNAKDYLEFKKEIQVSENKL